jgi:3-phosphoshikimate 1-carboxyvinyltransferase
MGARLDIDNRRIAAGEPAGDLTFHGSEPGTLRGIDVPAGRAPRMIDEYPILAVAAAAATGITTLHGLGELRVKESDRLSAITAGLTIAGIKAALDGDTLTVHGHGRPPPGGGVIDSRLDHRIAMAFLVLGLAAVRPVRVAGAETIETSFPGFSATMNRLGARITTVDDDG